MYASCLATYNSSYIPNTSSRASLSEEIAYLGSLQDVERASIERCEQAGAWRGVTPDVVDSAAEKAVAQGDVVLRLGATRLITETLAGGGKVIVVSVAWSRRFIRTCLRAIIGEDADKVEVKANEIGNDGKLDRYFEREGSGIWTCADKVKIVREISDNAKEGSVVYVGDSVTDLECLTLVDVGICIRGQKEGSEQKELRETLKRVGIGCQWVLGAQGSQDGRAGGKGMSLWWARDFDEIWRSGLMGEIGVGRSADVGDVDI